MKSFAFNLLPSKSKEVEAKEVKRDNYSLYSALLPLFGVSLWLGLVVFNALVVDKVKANWEDAVAKKNTRIINEFGSILIQHGELVTKTNALSAVIVKDVQPEKVFLLTSKLFSQDEPGVTVHGYGREPDGSFNVAVSAFSYLKFAQITRRFNDYGEIEKVKVTGITYDNKSNEVSGSISFFFKNQ